MDNSREINNGYDDEKSPMDNLLLNTSSDAEKLEIHTFAKKHGISENESLWNQLLLQTGLIERHRELIKVAEEIQTKHVSDIQAAMDFAVKKILENASTAAEQSIQILKIESEKQIQESRSLVESSAQQIIKAFTARASEVCEKSISTTLPSTIEALNQTVSQIKEEIVALEKIGKQAKENVKISLLDIGIYCGLGALVGASIFYILLKLF